MRPTNVYSRLYLPQPQLILLDGLLGWSWRICWTVDENFGWSTPRHSLCVTTSVLGNSNDAYLFILTKTFGYLDTARHTHTSLTYRRVYTYTRRDTLQMECYDNCTRNKVFENIPIVRRATSTIQFHRTKVSSKQTDLAVLQTTTWKPPSPQAAKTHF